MAKEIKTEEQLRFDRSLGKRIHQRIKRGDITLLAKKMGISAVMIHKYLSGEYSINAFRLWQLLHFLNIPSEDIFL